MFGVQRVRLCELNANIHNALVVGIIIAKSPVRTFNGRGKSSESRGVTAFTLRDSEVDIINCDVWGSEYFAHTFYDRFLVGDTIEISSAKICVKQGDRNENFKPHVTSPFFLSLNEGQSDVCVYSGEEVNSLLRLLHVPSKPASGYHGLADVLKITEGSERTFVDLLVVVKSVGPTKNVKTKVGVEMCLRSVELADNTTPATVQFDIFDKDTIQRASEWTPLESVLFIADARVSWRWRACSVSMVSRTVITHQPHTQDAEALRIYAQNLPHARGASGAAAWATWGAESAGAASVAQVRDRLTSATPTPFTLTVHAILTHLELDELSAETGNGENVGECVGVSELRVRLADHTGELTARMEARALEEPLGHTVEQMWRMSRDQLSALRWRLMLERCCARVTACPPRGLNVIALRIATAQDVIPLY